MGGSKNILGYPEKKFQLTLFLFNIQQNNNSLAMQGFLLSTGKFYKVERAVVTTFSFYRWENPSSEKTESHS